MRVLLSIVTIFFTGIILVWFITMLITSVYAFVTMNTDCYGDVIYYLDPRNFLYLRIVTIVWAIISICVGSVFGQLG